jgi:hypothetical protein
MAILNRPLSFGGRNTFGGQGSYGQGFGIQQGVSSAFAWTSDAADMQREQGLSLSIVAPQVASVGQLLVPSATSGYGLLIAANATGATTVSITVSAPSGSTNSITASTNAITIAPSLTATNAQIAALFNKTAASAALATAYVYGWQTTDPFTSTEEDPFEFAKQDLLAAFTQTTLLDGATTSTAAGNMELWGSNDGANWWDLGYGCAVTGPGSYGLNVVGNYSRWVQAKWTPNGSPVGPVYATWCAKGVY